MGFKYAQLKPMERIYFAFAATPSSVPPSLPRDFCPLWINSAPEPAMLPSPEAKLSGKMLYTTASRAQSGTRAMSARWFMGSLKYSERSSTSDFVNSPP